MDVHEVIIIEEQDQNMPAPSLDTYNSICRVCLVQCNTKEATKRYRNIHEEEAQMTIRSLIETYTYVKVPEFEDDLPQHICQNCLDFLIDIHMFRSRCRLNEDLLHKVRLKNTDKESFDKGVGNEVDDGLCTDETQAMINKINDERMGIYRCKDCHLVYDSRKALCAHRAAMKHSRRPGSKCPHCGKMFNTTALVQHLRVHTKEKPFACAICGTSFAIKANLRRHMKIHDADRSFTCEVCGKSFLRSETLAVHLKMHQSERIKAKNMAADARDAQECTICHKIYPTGEQLKIHLRYHKRTFLCTTCGKVFSTKANLTTHVRVHTGERPFACDVCSKAFTQASSLRTHQVIHTGDKSYVCHICQRKFAVKGNLMVHLRTHTGKTPHHCDICDKGFSTSSTLRKHMRIHTKHENEAEEDEDDEGEEVVQDTEALKDEEVYTIHGEEAILIEAYEDEEGESALYGEEIQVVFEEVESGTEEVEYDGDDVIEYEEAEEEEDE